VGQSVPVDGERPELEGDGIELRVDEHAPAASVMRGDDKGRGYDDGLTFPRLHREPTMSFNRRSKNITEGVARAPNRSMYYAMGYQPSDFAKPMIGVANGHSTITPCNSGLQRLADAAVDGLKDAGANPQIFGTPTISDGMAMGT